MGSYAGHGKRIHMKHWASVILKIVGLDFYEFKGIPADIKRTEHGIHEDGHTGERAADFVLGLISFPVAPDVNVFSFP